jgi:DNA helicase IV
MPHPDLAAEQAHVDLAYTRLDAMRAAAEARLREAFGERGGTFQALAERDIRVRNSLTRLEQLQIGEEALVFGRIDRHNGSGESFHIGRLAVSDVDQEPLVVDWRAPVAEPFYRATGADPMGLRRRRHFLTQARRISDIEDELFDPDGIGEGRNLGLSGSQVLLAALERSRTGRMPDIVATVQREQDEVIRGPLPGITVVQGGPGTGKTAVALHRAAYLLYTHRFPLERQGVLVVGPNPLFLRYIEHVLPSLGETGVQLSTVTGLFPDVVPVATEPARLDRLKGDPRMARLLDRAVRDRQRPLRHPVAIPYGRFELQLTPEATARMVGAAKRRPGTHNHRRRLVESLLWRHLADQVDERPGAAAAGSDAGEGGDREGVDPEELGRELRRRPEVARALDRMWPVLRPAELLHDLFGARPLLELAGRRLLDDGERAALYRPRSGHLDAVPWTQADVALLDEAAHLLGPPRRRPEGADERRAYGHIVVDEAQDLSPMELRMIARRSISGSLTVVGDIGQGTSAWAPRSWSEIVRHLPSRRPWRLTELTINYRTPAEIMSVAAHVLAEAEPALVPPEAIRSSGETPRVVAAPAPAGGPSLLGATVVRTLAEELAAVTEPGGAEGIVGVIAPPSSVDEVAAALSRAGIPFGRSTRGALDSVVSLLTVTEAKGLEFDSVVVVEPAALVDECARGLRALYVAMTRSTRRLALVHARPLPTSLVAGLAAPAGGR